MQLQQGHALALTAALCALAVAPAMARAQGPASMMPPSGPFATVVTAGDAVVRHAPDRAFVTVAVESRAARPTDAQRQNAVVMTAVHEKLAALGLPKSAVETTSYDLQQEFTYENGKQTPKDFLATNTIQITIDDLATVGTIVDATVGAGATSVRGVRFDLKDRASVEREALRLAVIDAKARAEALAEAAGMTVERIVRIDSVGAATTPRPMVAGVLRAAPEEAKTPITPGDLEIRAHVTLTAALK